MSTGTGGGGAVETWRVDVRFDWVDPTGRQRSGFIRVDCTLTPGNTVQDCVSRDVAAFLTDMSLRYPGSGVPVAFNVDITAATLLEAT